METFSFVAMQIALAILSITAIIAFMNGELDGAYRIAVIVGIGLVWVNILLSFKPWWERRPKND